MKKPIIVAAVLTVVVTVIMDLILDIAAANLQSLFTGREWLIYLILAIIFVLSVALTIYLLLHERAKSLGSVRQTAVGGGQIRRSPIKTTGEGDIEQLAQNRGQIEDSGITVE